jgi:hypothetical protein
MLGKFTLDLSLSYGSFTHKTIQDLAQSPSATYFFFLKSAAIALIKDTRNLCPDLLAQLAEMLVQLL